LTLFLAVCIDRVSVGALYLDVTRGVFPWQQRTLTARAKHGVIACVDKI
jgi:hypothetical protein